MLVYKLRLLGWIKAKKHLYRGQIGVSKYFSIAWAFGRSLS
jgi:hypothetical protein